jgi:hypothetical protein
MKCHKKSISRFRTRIVATSRYEGARNEYGVLRCVHITRAHAGARQACARRAFICVRKSSSTLLQLLARFRRVRIRIFTRSVYRL